MVLSATAQSSVLFSLSLFSELSKMRLSCKIGVDHWGNIKLKLTKDIVQCPVFNNSNTSSGENFETRDEAFCSLLGHFGTTEILV